MRAGSEQEKYPEATGGAGSSLNSENRYFSGNSDDAVISVPNAEQAFDAQRKLDQFFYKRAALGQRLGT